MEIKNNSLKGLITRAFGLTVTPSNLLVESSADGADQDQINHLSVIDDELIKRAGRRLYSEEINKQKNIEDVVYKTDEMLQSSPRESEKDDALDQGWVDEWLDGAGRAYDDDLKQYWAKLLAGEINVPGTYSLRAIDLMKKLSKSDAERIRMACRLVLYTNNKNKDTFILRYNSSLYSYSDICFLMELRILNYSSMVVEQIRYENESGGTTVFYHNDYYYLLKNNTKEYDLPIYSFTELGKEILSIIDDQSINVDYLKEFSATIAQRKGGVSFVGGHLSKGILIKNGEYFEIP